MQRIFQSVIAGKIVTQIAEELSAEGVLIPSAHWDKIGAGMRRWENANSTKWAAYSPYSEKRNARACQSSTRPSNKPTNPSARRTTRRTS
ncbi:MAG: hypothetical protein LBP36_02925 [Oscillospiraceae bacterium]|nr:hypothetical protein [Oscillospiraceae bacterium]